MADLALARKLVVGIGGPQLAPAELAWLERYQPAGVILFARNVVDRDQLATLCRSLHAVLPEGAEVVADHEGGAVSVLAAALGRPPAPWSLGALGRPERTRKVHRETAGRLAGAGLDRVLAPCADVLVAPENPVIGSRAFGADPDLVATHVAAAVAGLSEGGVKTCLKHWPGHGGTLVDSHERLARTGSGEVPGPFAAGLAAGADAILVGHLVSPGEPRPATLSIAAADAARRLAPGRPVLLFTDDVTMGGLRPALAAAGVSPAVPEGTGMLPARSLPGDWFTSLAAGGCDRLLCRDIPWAAFPLSGDEEEEPVEPAGPALPDAAGSPAYREVHREIAGLFSVRVPVAAAGRLLWLDATAGDRWGEARDLEHLLRRFFPEVVRVEPGQEPPPATGDQILLVTSHRPLAADLPGPARAVLTMGHPSLGSLAARRLGSAVPVLSLFDVRPADLLPVLDPEG